MVLANQMRAGMAVVFENQTYRVIAADYHAGQGKMGGVMHARLQNIHTRTFRELSLRAELKLQDLPVERQSYEFLYVDDDQCWLMNPENFEQTAIPTALVGPHIRFLEPGMKIPVEFVSGEPVFVAFPDTIEVRIADTAPPTRQQADAALKPAKLANGLQIMVPQFIKDGDMVRIDLQTMKYMDRAHPEAKAKNV